MDAFLTSNNREIVRSVLGFVKVSVISLPKELMLPRLNSLIPNLMTWSHEHKAQFKAKVKHIIERMIRRFGYDTIERNVPDEDKKLVINIRKTKERNKRKKEAAGAEDEDDAPKKRNKFESEFDEAIYSSESDAESGEEAETSTKPTGKRRKGHQQFIVEDEAEPLDLLNKNALAYISSTKPQAVKGRKARTDVKTNASGKLILGDVGDKEVDKEGDVDIQEPELNINDKTIASGAVRDGISAYIQALKGKDAVKRGQRDRLKFSNKRQRDDGLDEDEEMEDADAAENPAKKTTSAPTTKKNKPPGKHERKVSLGRKGDGGFGGGGSRVQKSPKSPSQAYRQRGGGTASIGRKK